MAPTDRPPTHRLTPPPPPAAHRPPDPPPDPLVSCSRARRVGWRDAAEIRSRPRWPAPRPRRFLRHPERATDPPRRCPRHRVRPARPRRPSPATWRTPRALRSRRPEACRPWDPPSAGVPLPVRRPRSLRPPIRRWRHGPLRRRLAPDSRAAAPHRRPHHYRARSAPHSPSRIDRERCPRSPAPRPSLSAVLVDRWRPRDPAPWSRPDRARCRSRRQWRHQARCGPRRSPPCQRLRAELPGLEHPSRVAEPWAVPCRRRPWPLRSRASAPRSVPPGPLQRPRPERRPRSVRWPPPSCQARRPSATPPSGPPHLPE
jgi:hypothetical protein